MKNVETVYAQEAPDHEARNHLVMSEISQVYYLARRIQERLPQNVALEDLVHAGVLGLMDAVRNYDPGQNASFKSYAAFRIRGAIIDSLRELDWATRRLRRKGRDISESITRLTNKFGRQPSEEEIAEDLKIDLSELQTRLRKLDSLVLVGQRVASQVDDSGTHDLIENAPADEDDSPLEQCMRTERSDLLSRAISALNEKEQSVLSLYYREELTMKETAAVMGLAESRISQIHSLAIAKLRVSLEQMNVQRHDI
jgi:RNA polymerase sigma factor for flagellar operon FliA